jgi:hypothetical protein
MCDKVFPLDVSGGVLKKQVTVSLNERHTLLNLRYRQPVPAASGSGACANVPNFQADYDLSDCTVRRIRTVKQPEQNTCIQ